jgi:hypothetical protein
MENTLFWILRTAPGSRFSRLARLRNCLRRVGCSQRLTAIADAIPPCLPHSGKSFPSSLDETSRGIRSSPWATGHIVSVLVSLPYEAKGRGTGRRAVDFGKLIASLLPIRGGWSLTSMAVAYLSLIRETKDRNTERQPVRLLVGFEVLQ